MGVLRFTSFLKEVVRSGPQNTVYKEKTKKRQQSTTTTETRETFILANQRADAPRLLI